jgi:hypothetical protein
MTDKLCVNSRAYFSDHLDGVKLPMVRGLIVRWHLLTCPRCKRYQRSLVATRDALRDLRDLDPK